MGCRWCSPLAADQPETARKVTAIGAGITLLDPDAPSLRAAVARALVDPKMHVAAARIAREIAAMPSMDDAILELQRLNPN